MERGSRELVAGLTRTAVQPVTQRPVDAVVQFYTQQKAKQEAAQRAEQTNYQRSEDARKTALDAQRRKEDLGERDIDNKATSTPTTPAMPTTITSDAPRRCGMLCRFISTISRICVSVLISASCQGIDNFNSQCAQCRRHADQE